MASKGKEIVLITGANTGLGFETAKKLLRDHGDRFYVLIGARTPSKGEAAVKTLHDQGLTNCEVLEVDVTSEDSIARAAKSVEQKFGRLDVLHANASIAAYLDGIKKASFSKKILSIMATNTAGAAQTVETFVPLLQKSDNARIVFISSGLGSIKFCIDLKDNPEWPKSPAYSASKAALHIVMAYFYAEYPDMKVNSSSPGFRATALNDFAKNAPGGAVPGKTEDGANNAVRLSLLGKDGESGTHTQMDDATGEVKTIPW